MSRQRRWPHRIPQPHLLHKHHPNHHQSQKRRCRSQRYPPCKSQPHILQRKVIKADRRKWGTNITYWLENSLPTGYQNQSSAWLFGGENIKFEGHGYGTFNGSGQAWYTFIHGVSNYPRRPHQITITNTTSSSFTGLRFLQSQMWYVIPTILQCLMRC